MIKDLTDVFTKGILHSENYNPKIILKRLENLPNICYWYDEWNCSWYHIQRRNEKGLIEDYGYLSAFFSVALLIENCPDNVRELLEENGIFTDEFHRRCSCDEDILKQYVDFRIIDDMKLVDGRISFDSTEFEIIASGCDYITPYDFNFYDII